MNKELKNSNIDVSGINPALTKRSKKDLSKEEINQLYDQLVNGDRFALSRAITLVESLNSVDQSLARLILDKGLNQEKICKRIAVSGAPGAGKSSFLEALGLFLVSKGLRIAILAIDPSSVISKGSILADKTRMPELSNHPNAFIRPTASASYLGGIARSTKENIQLCEMAGYDIVFVETVGVGQSETSVTNMVDFLLLLIQPGAGDGIQGIKRGIMELSDLIVINKADGEQLNLAQNTKADYEHALRLMLPKVEFWKTKLALCSSIEKKGLHEVWQDIEEWYALAETSWLKSFRIQQNIDWFLHLLQDYVVQSVYQQNDFKLRLEQVMNRIKNNKISIATAYAELSNFLNL